MGFFSTAFNVVKSIGRAVLGIPPTVKRVAAAPVLARAIKVGARGASLAGTGIALGVGAGLGLSAVEGDPDFVGPPSPGGISTVGGNGRSFRRTLVQTIDRDSGVVEKTIVLRGAPFVMRHDVQIAKRVIRLASRLGKLKGLRHTVKQSMMSRTNDAIQAKVLAGVIKDVC